MIKIMRVGTIKPAWTKRGYDLFIKAEIENGVLSITGVEGPLRSGNARGSSGQISMGYAHRDTKDGHSSSLKTPEDIAFAPGWNAALWLDLLDIWERWHLNDMRAGCEHQRKEGWENRRINPSELPDDRYTNRDERGIMAMWVTPSEHKDGLLGKPCKICGFKYGSKWLKEELPQSVIDFISSLPDTDKQPAWI